MSFFDHTDKCKKEIKLYKRRPSFFAGIDIFLFIVDTFWVYVL